MYLRFWYNAFLQKTKYCATIEFELQVPLCKNLKSQDIKKIEQFCQKYHISSLALFGSILTPSFKKSSDVDFLVQFDTKHIPGLLAFIGMEMELGDIIGHKVDLRTSHELSPLFRDTVLSHAKIIYERT